ncbi:DUF4255 domain-containing protein [Saccharicrinis sp. FJH54]|uniref:DUF4255 domain-containing protein n=1 Tax=Saccharicrinis sp. FJH54 TaxID=3344665 RepID=UPI0035D49A48
MIYETLQILKEELEAYFMEAGLGKVVVLDNIAMWDYESEDDTRFKDRVVITLLKMEEETTLKNIPTTRVVNEQTETRNAPVHLNVFVLISANFGKYDTALIHLSQVIEFFQGKKIFTTANTVYDRNNVAFQDISFFRFNVELVTPDFEALNYVWGTLGGRQLPSVIYKIQLIEIERRRKLKAGRPVIRISGEFKDKT